MDLLVRLETPVLLVQRVRQAYRANLEILEQAGQNPPSEAREKQAKALIVGPHPALSASVLECAALRAALFKNQIAFVHVFRLTFLACRAGMLLIKGGLC